MRAHEIVARLEGFRGRGAGTDAERRAANWLAGELEHPARDVRVETFWCRPNWPLAHAWHVALAIAGSLISVADAPVGIALLLVALLSTAADALFGVSVGRRLTSERASQNVVARPRRDPGTRPRAIRLIVTANYDAGRTGLAYRDRARRMAARLRSATSAAGPGWLGWLCLAFIWLLVVAVLRLGGGQSTGVAVAQFIATAALVLVEAALLELGTADYGPAANDNGTGAAAAAALVRALDAAPPGHMDVELVLTGAGDGDGLGLRSHLRRRRPDRPLDRTNAAVLALAACGAGDVHWWTSDGAFFPLRYSKRFRQLCAQISEHADARPNRGRGATPALPARMAGIPAIALGCLDADGLVPRSHQRDDTATNVAPAALDLTVEFALILIDALDAFLAKTEAQSPAPPTETTSHAIPTSADP